MNWKEKIIDIVRNRRLFWRVILGTSIMLTLVTLCMWILRDVIKDVF